MRKSDFIVLGAVFASVLVTACATRPAEDNDPSEGGFFNAIAGTAGGQYEERLENRERQLGQEQATGEALRRRAAAIEDDRRQINVRLNEVRNRLAGLDDRLAKLRTSLDTEEGRRTQQWRKLQDLETRLETLRKRSESVRRASGNGTGQKGASNQSRQDEISRIEESLGDITDLVLDLAQTVN